METVKINQLEIENVKRIKALCVTPQPDGLTVIGGNNNQGKTSVLDAITWALGGDRYRPSHPERDGSAIPPRIKLTLSNGLIVERSGKNSALKVTDPNGLRSGQQLLNSFVEELALNLPKFMSYNNREKADVLLQSIGLKDRIRAMEQQEQDLYNRRRTIGQIAEQKSGAFKEMPFYADAPTEPVSALDLIRRQQTILARNGENQRKRLQLAELTAQREHLAKELEDLTRRYHTVCMDCETASRSAQELHDESTAQLEQDIADVERINIMVRANLDREKAEQEAQSYHQQYQDLTEQLAALRKEKYALLHGAHLPLAGLSVEDGELTYQGQKWDSMSGSDQLRVSTAIVQALKPQCGFVLLDKLEQMDLNTLCTFGEWLKEQGLQAIATRVSTGGECSIILEDGTGSDAPTALRAWKEGVF